MLKCVHYKQPLDYSLIRKFRNRVILYHARNPNILDLTMEHAQTLVSRSDVTNEEFNMLNNPLPRLNFNEMFRKVMQQDNNTWEALTLLKELKRIVAEFDYFFKLDEKNCPDVIILMTPTM